MSSTIHRFTPPTCTLEIIGEKSFLSRWTNSATLKKFQFKLRFDDPRQTTLKQVTIQGDRQELLQLQTAINRYIQIQLRSSFQAKNIQTIHEAEVICEQMPYLTPQGLMHHELFFGFLTHNSDRHSIRLGTVQLFDLVTALEAYQTKVLVSDIKQPPAWQKNIPLGGGIAAVAIAAIAIITTLKPQIQPERTTKSSQPPQSGTKIPELNEITPPSTPDLGQKPPTPKLREPLTSTKRLPPPPAVETPKPKPNIPDPADYPLSDVARQSGLDNLVKNKASNNQKTKSAGIGSQPTKPKTTILEEIPTAITSPQVKTTLVKPAQDLAVPSSSNQANQVQQITAYFERQWQPPADLNQSLEYRLFIDRNGSITQITPLGKTAQLYLSQTNIPVNGEAFIAPLAQSQPSIIRLLLNPNGKVQVFTESKVVK
jgi:hypothetical protein